ncbi:MAG TPA: SpoIIE family protein phosphatase [Candidatus Aquicultor sp.]|jgi:GAF domain-containing protein/HAMP domain-containing protein
MFRLGSGIRKKIFISYLAIIIPLLLVIVYTHYNHFLDKRQAIIESRVAFARNVATNFDHFSKEVLIAEQATGLAILQNDYTRSKASDYLASVANQYPVFSLDYMRVDGNIFASSDTSEVGTWETTGKYNVDYYRKNLTPDRGWLVTPLLTQANGRPGFDIVSGVWRKNKLAGIMVANIDSSRLNEIMNFDVPGGGYNITDNNGILIFQTQRPNMPLSQRDWSSHDFVRSALSDKEFTSYGLTFPADNTSRMGAQVPIHSIGWTAGSFVPVNEVMSTVRMDLFTSVITAITVILAAIILGYWMGRKIADPITTLAEKAKSIADGSFDEEVEVPETGDEIEELSESFNVMRLNLKEYVNELSGLVEVGEKMNMALNIPFVETAVTGALRSSFDAKAVWIALYNDREKTIRVDHFWSEDGDDLSEKLTDLMQTPGQGVAGRVLMTGKPYVIKDLRKSDTVFKSLALTHSYDSLITLPLISGGGALGVIEFYTPLTGQNRITEKEMGLLMALANQASVAIENARLYEETRNSANKLRASNDDLHILNKLALEISSGLDLNELLDKVVHNSIDLVSADMGVIGLYDKNRDSIEYECRTNPHLPLINARETAGYGLIEVVLRTKEPVYTNDYGHDPRASKETLALGVSAVVGVPLLVGSRLVGVLQVAMTGEKRFTDNDIALLTAVASQAAVAIENAKLYERERNVAETLQNALLAMPEELPGVKVGLLYRSATDNSKVGGDFYDFIEFTDGKIGVVIGDVSGKGLEAATATALAKMTIRAFAYEYSSPADVLAHGNAVLASQMAVGQFITMAYAVIDPATGALSYASAGHPAPLIINHEMSTMRQLRIGAAPLGVLEDTVYETFTDTLTGGEMMLLFTDGLIEARNGSGFFGEESVCEALLATNGSTVEEIPGKLLNAAEVFANGTLNDDVAIIALRLDSSAGRSGRENKSHNGEREPANGNGKKKTKAKKAAKKETAETTE